MYIVVFFVAMLVEEVMVEGVKVMLVVVFFADVNGGYVVT